MQGDVRNPMAAVVVYSIAFCRVMVTAIVCYVVVTHCRAVRDVEQKDEIRRELVRSKSTRGPRPEIAAEQQPSV